MSEIYKNSPEVTVLLSCYNGERWLAEAIDSVLNQTFQGFEFIIVDDGSTDNSQKIITSYAVQDPRIIFIVKSNTGLADSLNVGIRKARGKWIARLDADDICLPTRLELQLAVAKARPSAVFIGAGLFLIDEVGNASKSFSYPPRHEALLKSLTNMGSFPAHSSAFYRADIVLDIGGYRPRIKRSQDWDLWLRLSEKGALTSIAEPLIKLRLHSDQISHEESGRRQIIDSRCAVTSYWIRRLGYCDPVNADDETFVNFYSWMIERLEQEDLFAFYKYKFSIKTCLSQIHFTPSSLLLAIFCIFSRPRFIIKYFWMRFFGESIARRLAFEWIAKHKK